jgi:hypothetical protein
MTWKKNTKGRDKSHMPFDRRTVLREMLDSTKGKVNCIYMPQIWADLGVFGHSVISLRLTQNRNFLTS